METWVDEKRVRREIANSNERRRMQSINSGFQSLRTLLPQSEGEKLSKVSKYFYWLFSPSNCMCLQAAILQQTTEYIYQLEQEKSRLVAQNCHLKRLLGKSPCFSLFVIIQPAHVKIQIKVPLRKKWWIHLYLCHLNHWLRLLLDLKIWLKPYLPTKSCRTNPPNSRKTSEKESFQVKHTAGQWTGIKSINFFFFVKTQTNQATSLQLDYGTIRSDIGVVNRHIRFFLMMKVHISKSNYLLELTTTTYMCSSIL